MQLNWVYRVAGYIMFVGGISIMCVPAALSRQFEILY